MGLKEYVEENEGRRHFPYKDTEGKLTIGVGFNLDDVGLFDEEIDFILENRLKLNEESLKYHWSGFEVAPPTVKLALQDLYFNLGWPRLRGFKKMWAAIKVSNWDEAAKELLDSKYAKQVGKRAKRNSELILKGKEWKV